jgi:hypothetical protein
MHSSSRGGRRWHVGLLSIALLASGCAENLAPAVEIVLSEPSVDFRAVRGTTGSIVKTISVENGGDGRLGPVSCPANPAPWLTCAVSTGNTVTLTANPTGLKASPGAASVAITAVGAPDRPQSITANLIIDQPVLTLSAATVDFTGSENSTGVIPAAATVTVTNTGAGTLANLGSIACTPSSGADRIQCAVNQSTGVLTLSIGSQGLTPGTHIFPVVVSAANDDVSKTVALTLSISAVPRMSLSQQALVFQMFRGGTPPQPQTVTVTNLGGGSLGTIGCPASPAVWLSCAASGSTLTFAVNAGGLTVSPTGVSVPVTASGATNSPQSVTVNFTVRQPVLSVSTSTVNFTTVAGTNTTTPAAATVTVTNTGEGTLANLGSIACDPPASSPVTCVIDQNTGDLTLAVNPTGIVGTVLYPVVVSAPNSAVTRTVTVSLSATPGIALSPSDLNFQAVRGSTVDLVKKVKVNNTGNGALGTIACTPNPTVWLTCAVATGDTLVFTAKPAGLTTSPVPAVVPVTAVGAFNNPQNVTVTFTILQPVLSLNTTIVNLTVAAGGTAGPSNVTVTNTGAGVLADLGTLSCLPNDGHVSCAPNQSTGVVSITVNTAAAPALTPGKYVFIVTVKGSNLSNGDQTIAIVLTVT